MSDQLSHLLDKFSIQAGIFYSGRVCGLFDYGGNKSVEGHIHVLRSGSLKITKADKQTLHIDSPSVIFFPRPDKHSMLAQASDEAEVVCATVNYGVGMNNPLTQTLPDCLVLSLEDLSSVRTPIYGLLDEAFCEPQPGTQAILNRFMEVFIIAILRHLILSEQLQAGLLAGLAHPQLSKAISAMHMQPANKWTLQLLADLCFQSRSKFAEQFKQVVGMPALEYLTQWRIGLGKSLLQQGKQVTYVAGEVGYDSASSFAKAFKKIEGCSPKDWLSEK